MRILRVLANNLCNFKEGSLDVSFIADDKVFESSELFNIKGNIYTQNLLAFAGINASGKTRTLSILEYILRLILDKDDLNNNKIIPYGIGDKTSFVVWFEHEGLIYEWTAYLKQQGLFGGSKLVYEEEVLKSKPVSSVKTRKAVFAFSDGISQLKIERRSNTNPEVLSMLKDDSSITVKLNKENGYRVLSSLSSTNVNFFSLHRDVPVEILNLLDDNIEYIRTNRGSGNWLCELKFKNNQRIHYLNDWLQVGNLLSSGTIKGSDVFIQAMIALFTGGYFIIDEIENHFHKELVKLLMDLFKSKITNPYGATLIFSTHYLEILDIVDRKDNIYLLIKQDDKISAGMLSEYVHRNDLKKSDILLSGFIKGTAPKYESIKKFKLSVCEALKNYSKRS